MLTALIALLSGVGDLVRRRTDLEAELLALRHQVLVREAAARCLPTGCPELP